MFQKVQIFIAFVISSLFSRPQLFSINSFLHKLTLRSIGILNAQGEQISGEKWLINRLATQQLNVCIDVGANTKVFGIDELRAKIIYAFEPHPQTYKKLKNSTQMKNKFHTIIQLINSAVGNKTGTTHLWDFAENADLKHTQPTSTLASLNKEVIEGLHQQKSKSFTVPIITLDDFVQKYKLNKIDFLKIDVEGLELSVLKGATNLISRGRISIVQFEFNQMHVYQRVFFKDFIDVLNNYVFYRLSPNGLLKMPKYSPVTHEIFAFQNIVAIQKDTLKRWSSIFSIDDVPQI